MNQGAPVARSRPFATAVLFGASVLAGVLIFEAVSRLLGVDYNSNPNWRFHPVLGWTQERSKEFRVDVEGVTVRVAFNSAGFRDVEHELRKPPGGKRLVVVGDSLSEALQVELEETYWFRLGRLLERGDPRFSWEVVNLGVGDFGSAQSFLALTEIGVAFSPDLVLFQIFPLNDICNNSIELAGVCKSQNDLFRPYFVERDGELREIRVGRARHWLRTRFVSFGLLEKAFVWSSQPAIVSDGEHRARLARRGIRGDPLLYTFAPEDQQVAGIARGWRVTEAILRKVDDECRKWGIPWIPVVVPFEARLADSWSQFAATFPYAKLQRDYPEKRLGRLFGELGVRGVLLLGAFDANQARVTPYIDGHLNRAAHALMAREIYNALRRSGP